MARLIPIVFLGSLTCLMIGAAFGASWIRFGARGPQLVAVGFAVVILVALIIIIPGANSIIAAFQLWWLAIAAVVLVLVASAGSALFLRSATVR